MWAFFYVKYLHKVRARLKADKEWSNFVLGALRDKIRNSDIPGGFIASHSEHDVEKMADNIIDKTCPDDIFKEWLEWEGVTKYDKGIVKRIKAAIESIYLVKLVNETERISTSSIIVRDTSHDEIPIVDKPQEESTESKEKYNESYGKDRMKEIAGY